MILSFHPCFSGDKNMLVAGREPDQKELSAIKSADAVILPQGCRQSLYEMAKHHCAHVFPNYDMRFSYPGKLGQAELFEKTGVKFPETERYACLDDYFIRYNHIIDAPCAGLPFVFKFSWGGEGQSVYLIKDLNEFRKIIQQAEKFEKTGQKGFVLQKYIPNNTKTLRVVIMGDRLLSYWRIHDPVEKFYGNMAKGSTIDKDADPDLQENACIDLKEFCNKTKINLAGVDFLFSHPDNVPLFLEINYFFGRYGLGGSQIYYDLLITEINKWINTLKCL